MNNRGGAEEIIVGSVAKANGWWRAQLAKRLFDLCVLMFLAPILVPLFVLIAIAIAVDSQGPILYRYPRVGFNDAPFQTLKFRTMVSDRSLLTEVAQSPRNDPRITRVGRFLRRRGLDELPQMLNILSGEMSIVGYRPRLEIDSDSLSMTDEAGDEQDAQRQWKETCYYMPPGFIQPSHATRTSENQTLAAMLDRLKIDIGYAQTHTVIGDAKIVLTFAVTRMFMTGHNAF